MTDVAFIGLGAMGARMARRLVDSGHDVFVWNRTASKAEDLAAAGATAVESPSAAARRAEIVITMVADPAALEAVTESDDGIVSGLADTSTVIEMSTVGPGAITRLESVLPESVGLLDAPVLGSLTEAESGTLRIFIGGPDALVERWSPTLSALGSPMHAGPLGSGAAAKLVANSTLFGALGVLGEALALADGLGLSRSAAFDVLAATPIGAQAERRRDAIESGSYPTRFSLALAAKDAALVTDTADAAGVDMPLAAAARRWLTDAQEAGLGEDDYSTVLAYILQQAR